MVIIKLNIEKNIFQKLQNNTNFWIFRDSN